MVFWNKKMEEDAAKGPINMDLQVDSALLPTGTIEETSALPPESLSASPAGITEDPERMIAERFGGKVRTALGPGTVIQGKLSFDSPVRIDGKLSGEIFCSKALVVGGTGVVDAQIEAQSLSIVGTVKGNIKVKEKVEIFPGGKLEGTISTGALVILEGGFFNGNCTMKSAIKAEEATREPLKEALVVSDTRKPRTADEAVATPQLHA